MLFRTLDGGAPCEVAEKGKTMPNFARPLGARQRAQLRALKETANRTAKANRSATPSPLPRGGMTPSPLPIIPPITCVPSGSVEPISVTRLSSTTTKNTGEINVSNITAITQENNQASEQEQEEPAQDRNDDLQQVKNLLRKRLLECKLQAPGYIKMSAHALIMLDQGGFIETFFRLKETNILVETDPTIGDDIRCCDA